MVARCCYCVAGWLLVGCYVFLGVAMVFIWCC